MGGAVPLPPARGLNPLDPLEKRPLSAVQKGAVLMAILRDSALEWGFAYCILAITSLLIDLFLFYCYYVIFFLFTRKVQQKVGLAGVR